MGHLDTRDLLSAPAAHLPGNGPALFTMVHHSPEPDRPLQIAPDRLAELAQALFGTPVMVSLVDGERCDLGLAEEAPAGPAKAGDASPTAATVAGIPRADDSSAIGAPGLGFRAESPLQAPDGRRLGTLRVASPEPRPAGTTAEDGRRLAALAGIAAEMLEARLRLRLMADTLAERDLLSREADHRIANGLQLIHGALSLQAATESGEAVRAAIREAARRVAALAGAHRHLHSAAAATPDAAAYLTALVRTLVPLGSAGGADGADAAGRPVVLTAAPEAAVAVPAGLLPRLGLVAAELVTNALKHGTGRVQVELCPAPAHRGGVLLAVSDEGPGFPPGFDPAARGRTSLGMRLVVALTCPGIVRIDPDDRRRIVVHLMDRSIPQGHR
jgi:two-component sensor histidine kinase